MQTAEAAGARHVTELDGIRGLAILLVLITHFGVYGHESVGWFGAAYHKLVDFGWSGVDLFFVLSGFLITGILLESKGSPGYFRSFYMRRVLRILPLYYCAVMVFFIVLLPALRILAPGRATITGATRLPAIEQLWYYFHLSNWRIAYNVTYNGVDHFWSLAIEEQFYAVWPLVVFLLSRRALLRVCGGVMALSFMLRSLPSVHASMQHYPHVVYCLTPFRVEPLALGSCLAVLISDERFRAHWREWAAAAAGAGALCLAVVMAVTRSSSFEPIPMAMFGYSGVGLVAAAGVCYAAMRSGASSPGAAFLRSPALVELGRLSYGIYVIHRPLSILAPPVQAALMPRIGGVAASLVVTFVGSAASYFLAIGSWHWIEQPFLRLKSRFPYHPEPELKAAA
jgi:peptidoglycan/LPS O-acetylase OafA/YrhL